MKPDPSVVELLEKLRKHEFKTTVKLSLGFMSKPIESKDDFILLASTKYFTKPLHESFIQFVEESIQRCEVEFPHIKRMGVYVFTTVPFEEREPEPCIMLRYCIVTPGSPEDVYAKQFLHS